MATSTELAQARKAGFKKKKPKKPMRSAPISAWERYDERAKAFDKEVKDAIAKTKKKEALIKKHS